MDPYGLHPRDNFVEWHDTCRSPVEQYWIHLPWFRFHVCILITK